MNMIIEYIALHLIVYMPNARVFTVTLEILMLNQLKSYPDVLLSEILGKVRFKKIKKEI